jgi:hypothetical protein
LDEEKLKHACLAQQNGVWPNSFAQFAKASRRHSKAQDLIEKSIKNMI